MKIEINISGLSFHVLVQYFRVLVYQFSVLDVFSINRPRIYYTQSSKGGKKYSFI